MKRRLLLLSARLYPRAWLDRYGEEFAATLEDMPATSLSSVLDVVKGAIIMQTRQSVSRPKMMAAFGLLGLLAALGWTAWLPAYQSTAVVGVSGADAEQVAMVQQKTLTRVRLRELIDKHGLYPAERATMPVEDLVERMQERIRVSALIPSQKFTVSFADSDPQKAERVTADLAAAFLQTVASGQPETQGGRLTLAAAPSKAEAAFPNWAEVALLGMAGGLLLGVAWLLVTGGWRSPVAQAAAAGLVLAGAGSYTLRDWYVSRAILSGAVDSAKLVESFNRTFDGPRLIQLIDKHNLYPAERGKQSPAALAAMMQKHISVAGSARLPGGQQAFSVRFMYPDPKLAQRVTADLAGAIIEEHRELVVRDIASLPQQPISPNRLVIGCLGLVGGLLLGGGWTLAKKRRRGNGVVGMTSD